jgi:hypothetical protein
VVLVLLHEAGWPTAAVWEKWERLHGGTVAVVCHYKQGAPLTGGIPGLGQIQARMCNTRVLSRWGDISLTGELLHMLTLHPPAVETASAAKKTSGISCGH